MEAPSAAAPAVPLPAAARAARAALLAALAAGPAAWLLLPPLLRPGSLPGAPSGAIYALLHRYWAATTTLPPRFPEPGAALPPDALPTLLAPLTAAAGAPATVTLLLVAGFAGTLAAAWRYARRHTEDAWIAAAATAAFTASPALIAGVTSGDLDAWHGWAILAPALVAGPAALAIGVAAALVAPTMLPAAFLPALLAAWQGAGRARWWPIAAVALGCAVRTALGWPVVEGTYGADAWFAHLEEPPSPERVSQVYVGFVAAGLLLLATTSAASRRYTVVAAVALFASLQTATIPPERFLFLVPLFAALGGLGALRSRALTWGPTAAVLVATALVGEGWKGVSAPVPLTTATLADPAPVEEIAEGPVLDLPATRGAIRRALWFQARHGQPIAADHEGLVGGEIVALANTLTTGGCADPATLGFRTVVARREGALRELGGLRACLGDPAWDDGAVAVWRFEGPTAAPGTASPATPPVGVPTDAPPVTAGSATPDPGR